ncbi:hypothetical protein ACQ4LE_000001 [Meloidogyne hapla]|uniref:Uncharacterized protein n=1 Tax=Meloidogyne hapla TaxID=6305 RepID=A0A1I8BZ18_MELHA
MHVHFVDAPPPPSYEQAVVECRSPFGGSTNGSLIAENGGMEISQRVEVQSELIREQEAEIGKLKRDLGRMREHVERMAVLQQTTTTPKLSDKLTQRLANIVDEEAEERRRKNRSRKGDILRGGICCLALLAVVLAGLYVVLSRPNHFGAPKPSVEQFQILGKTIDNLCWAQGLIHPFGRIQNCNIFRRSRFEQKLFCEFSLVENVGNTQSKQLINTNRDSWRQKGIIVIKEESLRKRRDQNNSKTSTLLYTLNETEISEARKLCTEQLLPKISSTQTRKSLVGRWNSKNKKLNFPTTTTI